MKIVFVVSLMFCGVFLDTDVCEPNPCENGGDCYGGDNDYVCKCQPGYEGKNCQLNIDDCKSKPCQNEGDCYDGINDYVCRCKQGYKGKNCQKNINDCEPNPCKNGGSCYDGVDKYICKCQPGYGGENCQRIETAGCPPIKHFDFCKWQCNVDADCAFRKQICCPNGCGTECMDPI